MDKLSPNHVQVMAKNLLIHGQVIAWSSLDHVMEVIAKSLSHYPSKSWPINGKVMSSHGPAINPSHGQFLTMSYKSHGQVLVKMSIKVMAKPRNSVLY